MRKFFNRFGWLAMGWVAGSEANAAVKVLQNHLNDPTKALPLAIEQALEKTWQAFELALHHSPLVELKKLIASGTMRAALQKVSAYLTQQGTGFQQQCLQQLQVIQKDATCRIDLSQSTESLQSFHQPQNLLNDAQQILTDTLGELEKEYPELSRLLQWQAMPQDLPLFLTLFAYFLRFEVLNHPVLSKLLDLRQPLDLQATLKQAANHAPAQKLAEQQQSALNRANASSGVVQRGLSCSLYSEAERALLTELLKQYRTLPTLQQVEFSSLLNGLGKLAVATGDFKAAREYFEEAASNLYDQQAQAETFYNQYCTALEEKDWTNAFTALQQAVLLDGARFEPFSFKRYAVQRILGAGGFGTAFLCTDTFLEQPVVIKTLQREELNRDVKEVFREAHLLKKLNHVSIVALIDCDFADAEKVRRPYLVMEYVDALALDEYLTQTNQALSVDLGRQLAVQLAEALHAAHQQGILHRDVKPANVLVQVRRDKLSLKLIDFGLGLRVQAVQNTLLANNLERSILGKSAAGTVQFAAPEQIGLNTNLRVKSVGTYSDVYGFGKTLCYALFLNPLPNRRDWEKLHDSQFADLLSDCIAQEPSERPQTFEVVLKALAVNEVVEPEVAPKPQPKTVPENKPLGIFAAIERVWRWLYNTVVGLFKSLIFIVIVFGVIGAIVGDKKEKPVKQVAESAPAPEVKTEPPVVPKPAPVVTRLEFEPEMVLIPAGTFQMGSEDGASDEKPVHAWKMGEFYMSQYEVTMGQFKAFVQETGYSGAKVSEYGCDGLMKPQEFTPADNHPVSCVNWKDAEAYAAWLSKKTGKEYRLPTEAEWEYAARAGTTTKWYFGDDESRLGEYAWYWDNAGKQTHAVGQKKPNNFGLYDMAGNVWEWTCSEKGDYTDGKDAKCASGGDSRLLRGGSWYSITDSCRSAYRSDSSVRGSCCGFRVVFPAPRNLHP